METASKSTSAMQQSTISKECRNIIPLSDTNFSEELMEKNQGLLQAHFEQIADYLKEGEDVWYQTTRAVIEFLMGQSVVLHHTILGGCFWNIRQRLENVYGNTWQRSIAIS